MTEKEMIEIKHGSENMADLLNQEQAELKKAMIEELGNTLYCKQDKFDLSNPFEVAKAVVEEGYRKIPEGSVVLTMEEWARLRNLEINYNDAYNNYLLENNKLNKRVQELEYGIAKSMLGCEFLPDCCIEERKRVVSDVVNEIKAFVYNNDGLIEKINNIAKRYGVEVEE